MVSFLDKCLGWVRVRRDSLPWLMGVEMSAMQVAFISDYGAPIRVFHTMDGKHCTYPDEEL